MQRSKQYLIAILSISLILSGFNSAFVWSIAIIICVSISIGFRICTKRLDSCINNGCSTPRSILEVGQKVKICEVVGTVTASRLFHVIVTNEQNESIVIPTKSLMN
jgi:hypothetical protein